ncbi:MULTISPECIES: response regulator [unclassified Trichocoleus]|uniref:response regulator n=2 Tax=Cyanophyceae TaxID=3028117 RepID=UPI001F554ADE|nr:MULTISPECIES: response regulator [unclassified Trichocoleus]
MPSNKVLVIDDSPTSQSAVREILPKSNFEVLEAKDTQEGLNLIRQERPNLIVLNFLASKQSGWEVFQQIQVSPELQKIPLVLMSGRKEEVTQKIPEPFEYFEFVEKPLQQKTLIQAMKSAMAKAKLPRRQTASPPAQKAPASAATQKILIIDDAKVIRSQIPEMLPQGKFEVLEAKDGEEGLNLIRQESPNLILLDWIMPRLGGWEVFQQLQSQPELQTIPLVVMSGRKEEVKEKLSEPFEYFEFLEKPFNNKQLTDAIKSAMAKARRVRPSVGTASSQTAVVADSSAGVQLHVLNEKIATMQAEINGLKQQVAEIPGLKKQLAQLMAFVKQKLH